ncbi:secretion/DNA translocation related CpaE-like protein [Haloactinospora alba]|uniref:Secretion/DNA translocation related CpaE-like protein n=1 Tax=Haloactinospora alba TaxID=405555 RepID=A0A543NA55_9ACTN|nr:septum site-determining protein Ssd [Haloactinospora alba]TQN28711.1 secretion/DNA translocation related CpaE-like protein [Haloactinospora alba]
MDAPRPLLVTDDAELLDDLLRLAATAAVDVTVAHTTPHAARDWTQAPLVIAGTDLLPELAELRPDPHPNIITVSRETDHQPQHDQALANAALRIGARTLLALPDDEGTLVDLLADATQPRSRSSLTVAVLGGRGGAGASLLSVALAHAGQRAGARTALIDADPLGGGLDLLLGHERTPGTRWNDLTSREGRMSWPALRDTLPAPGGITLLTWEHGPATPVPVPAMRAVLSSASRGSDLVVLDLPRDPDAAAEEALRRSTVALLVVPAELHAVMAARRAAARARKHARDLRVACRSSSCDFPADTVRHALGLPLAGDIPAEPGLARTLDRGDPPACGGRTPLSRFADTFVSRIRAEHGDSEVPQ